MKLPGLFSRLIKDQRGVAALEFALLSPFLIFGLIMMTDTGLALVSRMEMDRSVRAGAQAAMTLDNDATAIQAVVLAAAGNPDDMSVTVAQVCECPSVSGVSCDAMCSADVQPDVYFEIAAQRAHSGILHDETLNTTISVRIR